MTRRTDTDLDPPTPTGSRSRSPSTPVPTSPHAPRIVPPPPTPPDPLPPLRAPVVAPARPGRRDEAPSDMAVTARLERVSVELTPAPLPPSPASADADRYFEQVPTNPGAVTRRDPTSTHDQRAISGVLRTAPPPVVTQQPWVLPVLLVATALAVGMVLGALLFGNRGPRCPPCAPAAGAPAQPVATPR